jgi:hypothetical protein
VELTSLFFAEDNQPGGSITAGAAAAMASDDDDDDDESSSSSSTQAPQGYGESSVVDEMQGGGPVLTSPVRVSSTRYPFRSTPKRQQTRLQFVSIRGTTATSSSGVAGARGSSSTTTARKSDDSSNSFWCNDSSNSFWCNDGSKRCQRFQCVGSSFIWCRFFQCSNNKKFRQWYRKKLGWSEELLE